MKRQQATDGVVLVDLARLIADGGGNGPQWSYESADLDLTLLSWTSDQQVAPHVNDEVDVLLIAVAGTGEVAVHAEVHRLSAGQALLIPKGAERAIRCTAERFSYLSVHRRRRGLWPTVRGEHPCLDALEDLAAAGS